MAETKGSNYVWWFLFTGSVLSGFVITLCLDGFFGTAKVGSWCRPVILRPI